MTDAFSALSDAFRIAVYDTYDKSHPPETRPIGKRDGPLLLDKHAILVSDCWVYPIVSNFPEEKSAHVPFELRVDPNGVIQHPLGAPRVHEPIEARPAAYEYNPDHPRKVAFHTHVDAEGQPLLVRLFASPFRLTSTAVKDLCTSKYRIGRARHLPSLWTWTKKESSALRSANGYYLEEIRTYITVPPGDGGIGVPERVWMAHDPFRLARRRSDFYVRAWSKFARRFEPEFTKTKQWRRDHLLSAINSAIQENASVPSKYKKAINYSYFEDELNAYNTLHKQRSDDLNDYAKHLTKSLRHPFFQLLQFSSMEKEGVPDNADYSEALRKHIETLAFVTRNLHSSPAGTALILEWISDSKKTPHHFVNTLIFPDSPLATHIFKTVRWSSKALFSAASYIYDRTILLRNKTASDIAESLFHVGLFETVEAATEGLRQKTLNFNDIKKAVALDSSLPAVTDVDLLKIQNVEKFEKWLEQDLSDSVPWLGNPVTLRRKIFNFLDTANVALAYIAVHEAATVDDFRTALTNALATTTTFSISITEQVLDGHLGTDWKTTAWGHRTWRFFRAANGLASFLYAVADISSALRAFDKGEKEKGWALLAAAAAEGGTAVIYLYQAIAGGPVLGGALVVLGAIAAASYAIALHTGTDPLEKFLKNCEFGITPYEDTEYSQLWTGGGIASWEDDYRKQMRTFIRVLTRFAIHWKRTTASPNPLQVNVDCYRRTLDTRITVTYVAELADGTKMTDKIVRRGAALGAGTAPISFEPPTNYIDHKAQRVTVHAQLEVLDEGYDHSVFALLWSKHPNENHNFGRASSVD